MESCIWYVSKYLEPLNKSSTGSRGFHLSNELNKRGYKVKIFTADSPHLQERKLFTGIFLKENINGLEIIWIKTIDYIKAKSIKRILSWVVFELRFLKYFFGSKNKPKLIIASSLSILSILSALIIKACYGTKVIFEIRDIWPLTLIESGNFSKANPFIIFLRLVEKIGYVFSDAIVGTMPNLNQHIIESGFKNKKVHCVPMGISNAYMQSCDEDVCLDFLPKNKFTVCYAGTLGFSNALEYFFETATAMEKTYPNIHFVLVGGGEFKSFYKEKYSHLTNITFGPQVNKNQVNSVLQNVDLLYFSTFNSKIWKYGQSLNKLVDYMFSGKPIIGLYSGYYSMINEANCGKYVAHSEYKKIPKIIESYSVMDKTDLEKIGNNGLNWLLANRKYSELARKYSIIIDNILSVK